MPKKKSKPDDFKNPKRTKTVDLEAEDRKRWLYKGREIYETFKLQFIKTPCLPQDVPARFMALRDKLTKEIKHKDVLKQMLLMVDDAMAKADYAFPKQTKKQLREARRAHRAATALGSELTDPSSPAGPQPRRNTTPGGADPLGGNPRNN